MIRHRKTTASLKQRLGFLPRLPRFPKLRAWVHAVSVGELLAIHPLIQKLSEENLSLVISTTTAAGNHVARERYADLAEAIVFFPFDFSFCVKRSLEAIRPDFFLMVETEIWPNFIWNCARRRIPTVMVNGRISDHSFPRYLLIRRLLTPALRQVHRFCMQTTEDARRLIQLGADPARIRVTGNLKYDIEPLRRPRRLNQLIRELLGAGSKVPLLVAGSTASGEEKILLDVLREIRKQRVALKMVIAPRHPERFREVADLLQREEFTFIRRSFFSDSDLIHPLRTEVTYDIFLLDSIGELTGVYEAATAVFVGKSLVPGGGQNILEPAYFGKPILFGPYMDNFREIAETFLQQEAAIQVIDGPELAQHLLELLRNRELRAAMSQRASKIVSDNRGAAHNTMHEIRELVDRQQSSAIRGRTDE
ncbi:MAG TPA: 3-deoxy-D-manno-octulosonic acid transferase [Acidobacteriota bacterium]